MESALIEDISNLEESTPLGLDTGILGNVFVYDVVKSKSCGKIGLVTEVADEFDWYESSFLSPDQIEVLWENDTDRKCINLNDVTLVNRGLLDPGMFVAPALDPSSQCGVVTDVNVSVDLLTPNGSIIEGIDTRELIHVKDFSFHSIVVLGPWIGTVVDILDNVTVLFDNGSVSEFIRANETCLQPIDNMIKINGKFPNFPGYYPGQRVKAQFRSVCYKSPRFLPGLWKPESLEGTITKVSVESVRVKWSYYVGRSEGDYSEKKPDEKQSPEKLKLLPFIEHRTWVLFARCRLKNVQGVLTIVNMKKKVDVAWQDGTIGRGLDSATLIIKHETNTQFFPGQFIRMKNTCENHNKCENRPGGLIRSVDSKAQTALVRWQQGRGASRESEEFDDGEEEVSIYELEIHPDRELIFGTLVGWSPPSLLPSDTAEIPSTNGDFMDHPPIGLITGFENGLLNVSWNCGADSKVVPEDIFVVKSLDCGDDDNYYSLESEETETLVEKLLFPFVDAIAIHVIRVLGMIYAWGIKHSNLFGLVSPVEENKHQCQKIPCNPSSSKVFDVLEDSSDHYFVGAEVQGNARRKWLKKVQEDWGILQNDLPDGIFVRVYEDQMHLLRAMIVGPCGTPYQDGLFFFDFHLPPEYPDVPPVVHYHSGGWRINPNLYEDGKICLSLLNTWHGKGNEMWDSSSSSILQVLVSIQGLVLNSEPYFNEAGYDTLIGSTEGENDSLYFNEDAYLLNCKRMMQIMRQPLKGFEELVRDHFIDRGYYILKACDAYLKGYLIGSLTKDASPSRNSKPNANSLGLKRTLAMKIAPKLFFALNQVGADCQGFSHLLQA